MNNEQIMELTHSHVMNTYGRQPLALVKGQGTRVWDAQGRVYLDFVTGVAVNSVGHCHPKVVAAIQEAAATLIHCSNHYYIESQAKLAEFLTAKAGMEKAFFCNSGAEAIEAALKLARRYAKLYVSPARFEIITATNSFHGRTLGALTGTGQAKYHQGFEPLVPGFRYVPLNNIAALRAAVGAQTAAVLLEPIQGEGGVIPCTREYLLEARNLCTAAGIPLILDEVQTGLGRTGRWFAHELYGIKPDIMALAKALGGGVPIGCILANEQTAQGFAPGSHASTFGGGPLATSAALAALHAIEDEDMISRAAAAGAVMKERLTQMAARYPTVCGEVRGEGCLIGVQLKVDGGAWVRSGREKGLLINVAGHNVLRLLPPLNVSEEDLATALNIVEKIAAEQAAVYSAAAR